MSTKERKSASSSVKTRSRAIKTFLRRVGARTREAFQEALDQALETVTAQDAWLVSSPRLPLSQERKASHLGLIFLLTAGAVVC